MKVSEPITKIIVQTPDRFAQTVKGVKEVCKAPHYRVSDGISSNLPKFTTKVNTCSALALSNGADTYVGHYAPEFHTSKFFSELERKVKTFQDKTGEPCTGILVGGYGYNVKQAGINSVDSFEQLAEIGELLDKQNVDFSMFGGKLKPLFTESLAVFDDAFILSHERKIGTKTDLLRKDVTKQELDRVFSENYIVNELSDNHKLFIEG